jgi:hypothetical protein
MCFFYIYFNGSQISFLVYDIYIPSNITVSKTALGPTQPPIQCVPGALSLEVKRPGRKADHSPASSADVKNAWSYTSIPQYVFMAWCLVGTGTTLPLPLTNIMVTRA